MSVAGSAAEAEADADAEADKAAPTCEDDTALCEPAATVDFSV